MAIITCILRTKNNLQLLQYVVTAVWGHRDKREKIELPYNGNQWAVGWGHPYMDHLKSCCKGSFTWRLID